VDVKVPAPEGYSPDGHWHITDNFCEKKAALCDDESQINLYKRFCKFNQHRCMEYDFQTMLKRKPSIAEHAALEDGGDDAEVDEHGEDAPSEAAGPAGGDVFETPCKQRKLITAGRKPVAPPAEAGPLVCS